MVADMVATVVLTDIKQKAIDLLINDLVLFCAPPGARTLQTQGTETQLVTYDVFSVSHCFVLQR